MSRISRSTLLGASSAIALVGSTLLERFVAAVEAADEGDVKILDTNIAIERAGIKAYTDAASTGLLQKPVETVAMGFMKDHEAHRDALSAAVKHAGATPTAETLKLTYPALKSQQDILTFALSVERQAASAYLQSIPGLKDRQLAQLMGSILGVETTHVAVLNQVLGKGTEPYNGGFVTS
jgi:rubrerythrin